MVKLQKVVIKRGDNYLTLKRAPNAVRFPNLWDFPGGKLEPNEKPEVGAVREVKEETGIDVRIVKKLGEYEFDIDNIGEITHRFSVYEAEVLGSDEVNISFEHTEYRWASKEEILRLKIEPFMTAFFEEY